jgi:hypothetical protein
MKVNIFANLLTFARLGHVDFRNRTEADSCKESSILVRSFLEDSSAKREHKTEGE